MNEQSKTPETDAMCEDDYMINTEGNNEVYVTDTFARQLELSRNKWKERAEKAEANNAKVICMYCHKEFDKFAPETPSLMAEHIFSCSKSPLVELLVKAEKQCDKLESQRDNLLENSKRLAEAFEIVKNTVECDLLHRPWYANGIAALTAHNELIKEIEHDT